MGTVQSPADPTITCDDYAITDERQQKKKKGRFDKTKGRLRKAGFDIDEISRDNMIEMQPKFKEIAEEQLRETKVSPVVPNSEHFTELPYMEKFQDLLELNKKVYMAMNHYGINEPTPVQMVTIPYIKEFKNDLIVKAQTGSGKTFAFLLPIIAKIIELKSQEKSNDKTPNRTSPYAVVVAPTAELTWQLACDATRLINNVYNVKVTFAFGGLDMRESKKMLNEGCDLLFVPPGRLYHYFFEKGEYKAPLLDTKNIRYVVLDEADRLLAYKSPKYYQNKEGQTSSPSASSSDEKEEEEISVDDFRRVLYEFIVTKLSEEDERDFHVMMFSATIDFELFRPYIVPDKCVTISVGNDHPCMTVKQSFVEIKNEHAKTEMLCDLLEVLSEHLSTNKQHASGIFVRRIDKTLIFVNNKRLGERITHVLLTQGYNVASINSDRSTRQRLKVISDVLSDVVDIVVATDVLSRGINIPRVDTVINYDFPNKWSTQEYVHRVGRCGRIGNLGQSITFFDPKKDYASAQSLINGCKATNQEIPEVLFNCNNRHSPQQQYKHDAYRAMENTNTSMYPPKFFNTSSKQERYNPQQNYYRPQQQRQCPLRNNDYYNQQGRDWDANRQNNVFASAH